MFDARRPPRRPLGKPVLRLSGLVFCGLFCTACAGVPYQKDGTQHYLILGFGIVSVPVNHGENDVNVVKVQAIGATLSDSPGVNFGLGYSSSVTVKVPDRAQDTLIEVSDDVGGPLTVRLPARVPPATQ